MRAAAAAVALRRPLAALAPPPHLRPRILALLGGLLLLACLYLFWFRDSSFVSVQRVSISGLTSSDAPRLREELTAAAQTMTTLHVDQDRLDRVVAGYPAVERLELNADFPHTLRIDVIQFQPAAMLVSGRSRLPVAEDGLLLRRLRPDTSLPVIKLRGALPAQRLGPGAVLREVNVAGAAPAVLRRRLTSVRQTPDRGLVASLRNGPDLVFGDTVRLRAKWLAVARVLADKASRGASYIDVRLPDRPAAGGLPVGPADASATGAAPAAPAAPTTAAPAPTPTPTPPQAAPPTSTPAAPAGTPSAAPTHP